MGLSEAILQYYAFLPESLCLEALEAWHVEGLNMPGF